MIYCNIRDAEFSASRSYSSLNSGSYSRRMKHRWSWSDSGYSGSKHSSKSCTRLGIWNHSCSISNGGKKVVSKSIQ